VAKAQPIRNEVQGTAIIEALQKDVKKVGYEMIQQLVEQVESTSGMIPQTVTVKLKYTPGDEESPGTFSVFAQLQSRGGDITRAAKINRDGPGSSQLSLFIGGD
jgi:hypothetical protein